MYKIITVVGARPQFIKASAVSKRLKESLVREILVHTGQHYDLNMSDVFFQELQMPQPNYHLNIGSGTHGMQTGKMLEALEQVLLKEQPEMVIVYGDTNTTLAGALAASKLKIPVGHVEAGLRSYNRDMPEEINRVLTDHLSALLFVPTDAAVENLKKEGIVQGVFHVGDVMFDVACECIRQSASRQENVLSTFGLKNKEFILSTIHRAENTDNRENLSQIWEALRELAGHGERIIFPVHPRTKQYLERYGLLNHGVPETLLLTEPVSYREMIILENCARLIVTDSGGVQKEGYFFKTPAIIIRNETEWVELVAAGWNILTGADSQKIIDAVLTPWNTDSTLPPSNFYGDGNAALTIKKIVEQYLAEHR